METPQEPTKKMCIIHQAVSDGDVHLVSPQSHDSWLTLLEAAKVRNHIPILDIAKTLQDKEVPILFYHRKCRSMFTMKRELETLKRKAGECSHDLSNTSDCPPKKSNRTSISESRVYAPICIFCSKVKYKKHSNTRENLTLASQLRVDQTLRESAIRKGDGRMIALTSRDIVAAEAHYHTSCYRTYTRNKEEGNENEEVNEADEFILYHKVEREAYKELFEYIRADIIPNKRIIPVTSLTTKLESLMVSGGVNLLKDSTKKNMHRRLKSELEGAVEIFSDEKGKLLMVPCCVSLKDVVLENQTLHKELELWKAKSTDINKIIDQTSSHIRKTIKKDMISTPWPYHPSDVATHIAIPNELERFLVGLLTGDPTSTMNKSHRTAILVESFSQDMIYAVTRGQYKPPKHFLLPYAVKALTGNTEVIRTLNKFGHGVSYDQLEENDTALCLQKLAMGFNQKAVLPVCIKPHVFTNLAWDNIDRLEETLTGKGTSHRVNGIAVQPKVYGPHLPTPELPNIEKLKQRSVSIEHEELESYLACPRVGPHLLSTSERHIQEAQQFAQVASNKNLIWVLARQRNSDSQTIPSWTGFNINTRDQESITEDVVGYLPTINAPATEVTTVYEILKQSDLIRKQLSLDTIVVVMDQALYAKSVEITWKHKERFSHVLLRMGTFHTIMNALSIIGKRFCDSGLKDICIEAGLVAKGSINGVIDGKQYNRAIRVHKCIYEALMRLAWAEFTVWVGNKEEMSVVIKSCVDKVNNIADDLNHQNFSDLLDSPQLSELMILWRDFLEHLRHNNGELSGFWMSYIDMVEHVILGLLRASREGNWNLHINGIRTLIPWCFAYDKVNYARYLSAYFAEMTNLPETNPDVHRAFQQGQFSVQRSSNNPFGRIPVDQTIEVTVNKDTQTPGGTSGFSLKAGAIKRYYITAEYRSEFLGHLRDLLQGNQSKLNHADLQQPRIERDEETVSAVIDLIQAWANPFSEKRDLISISTAKTAPRDIASDLIEAGDIGEKSYANFKNERLENNPPSKLFHDPIKTNKLKTFTNMCKKKVLKTSGKDIILKADRTLFGRIIVMAQSRNLKMEDILSHPLGPLPWALSTPDGLLRKTNKASLATTLQKNVTVAEQLPPNPAFVVDGMNLVQRVKGDQVTFGDIATTVLRMALCEGSKSTRIDIVFDTYRKNSIKNSERVARGEQSGAQLQGITSTQIVRQWRSFLTGIPNKTSLISFIVSEWRKPVYREKLHEKIVYTTIDDKCYRITSHGSEEVPDLQCHQEEADGRLLFHAVHAAKQGYQSVVICTEDTDVFIMCLAFHDKIGVPLFQKCGTRTRTRLVDIKKVAAIVGIDVCRALIGIHAYTGCDTTSAFAGKGKANALKFVINNREIRNTFTQLGQEWDLSSELMDKLECFTCLLYGPKAEFTKVNSLRYHLFCVKKGEIESHQLPPCRDCLVKHAQRANYQAGIWRRCLEQDPGVPSPIGRGWKIDMDVNEELMVVDWMDGRPAPEAILTLLACKCSRTCTLPNCVCLSSGLKCTDMCKLPDCENRSLDDIDSTDEDDDADD